MFLRTFITTHWEHFYALIQRTDGCTDALVQTHHSIRYSYKRYTNRYFSQHMVFRYCDMGSGEPAQTYRLPRAFAASTRDLDTYRIVQ